jgi:hypothetical protein
LVNIKINILGCTVSKIYKKKYLVIITWKTSGVSTVIKVKPLMTLTSGCSDISVREANEISGFLPRLLIVIV